MSRAVVTRPRPGQLTAGWQIMVSATWTAVFFGFAAVWKASRELGIGTWWIGPRSDPQPSLVRMLPFALAIVVAMCAIYNVRRTPVVGTVVSVLLAAGAVPDIELSGGLAAIEFAIAGAALLVSLASFAGTYRLVHAPAATTSTSEEPVGGQGGGQDGGQGVGHGGGVLGVPLAPPTGPPLG